MRNDNVGLESQVVEENVMNCEGCDLDPDMPIDSFEVLLGTVTPVEYYRHEIRRMFNEVRQPDGSISDDKETRAKIKNVAFILYDYPEDVEEREAFEEIAIDNIWKVYDEIAFPHEKIDHFECLRSAYNNLVCLLEEHESYEEEEIRSEMERQAQIEMAQYEQNNCEYYYEYGCNKDCETCRRNVYYD